MIYGLATSRLPFMRTPKMDERATLGMALGMARGEAVLTILLWLGAVVLWLTSGAVDPEARLWSVFMVVQSLPYAAAVYVSVVNALEQMRHARAVFEAAPPRPVSPGPRCSPHSRSGAFPCRHATSSVSVQPCPRLNPPARLFS